MLAHLSIRDIVLIDRLDIDLAPQLTALTGETGAGKSIVLDAFGLALGSRGDASLVRVGAGQGQVVASFDLRADHPARDVLRKNGLYSDGELILRRVQLSDGKTKAFVNDQPVTVQVLKDIGRKLVEIHGQHDERALIDTATHRALLDAFGGLGGAAVNVTRLWNLWRVAEETTKAERERLNRAMAEADFIRHAVDELTTLAPQTGEEQALADRRAQLMRAEKAADDLRDAHETVAGAASPIPSLSAALRKLERRVAEAPELVSAPVKALDQALQSLEEARGGLESALLIADFDPKELEKNEERLFGLRAASRKYGSSVEELPQVAARFRADLDSLDRGAEKLEALQKASAEAEKNFRQAAEAMSFERRKAAALLDQSVSAELPPLKLERAEFITQIESDAAVPGPDGYDRVEFWVRTNPGARPGPLMKVASGGELARFLLALKVVLADRGSAPTLVFDEIDTAVGGAVSDAIGARLARLGEKVQVFSVTHAPQVAARASNHLVVHKEAVDNGTRVLTRITPMTHCTKREEIARMLAGAEVTEEARKAAERLIVGAR